MGPRKPRWCWVAQPWRPAPSTAPAARPPVRENLRRRTAILEKSALGASECSPRVLDRSLAYTIGHRTQSDADLFLASCISKLDPQAAQRLNDAIARLFKSFSNGSNSAA